MKKILLGFCLLVVSLSASDIYATFTVQAKQSANLAFSSSGIIDKVLVDAASIVKKGDTLAILKNDDLKALLEVSKTAVKYAKLDYDRQLKVKHMIDKSKFDKYAFKYENAKAQLKYQQSLFAKTILKAPFDGIIYDKLIEIGDVVSGQMVKTAFKIQSKNKRKLILEFDQKYWKEVKIGQTFKYGIDGDTKTYEAKISKIYPFANSRNRKIKAEVEVDNFIVGLFGEGYIQQ
ncbi:MAG: efflux RND transporter periplasmic adaptor subunit [Campylobacterota bacterium]|nr:efflux RND transporter periplasmic adaptor subunit [Campylobacterota bacterium]